MEFLGSSPYHPLRSNTSSIRLVTIKPNEFSEPIECQLEYVDRLSEQLRYEALSYVWGDPTKTIPIKLSGHSFCVTLNLESALRYLRKPQVTRRLWIDAICINQADTVERSEQVLQMGNIYKAAQRVIVWLGKEKEEPDLTEWLGPCASPSTVFAFVRSIATKKDVISHDTFRPSNPSFAAIRGLSELLKRPWFERTWVLQEVAVNRNVVVMCGTSLIQWETLIRATIQLRSAQKLTSSDNVLLVDTLYPFAQAVICQLLVKRPEFEGGNIADRLVVCLFRIVGSHKTTDPRDRLYGILGICGGLDDSLPDAAIIPNYQKTTAEVFKDLAKYLIEQRHSFDILCGAHETMNGLPSWAPSWGHQTSELMLGPDLLKRSNCPAEFQFLEGANVLRVKGVQLGKIGVVGPRANLQLQRDTGTVSLYSLRSLFKEWEEIIVGYLVAQNRFPNKEDALRAWKLVLMYNPNAATMEIEEKAVELVMYEALLGRMELENPRLEHMMKLHAFERYGRVEERYPFSATGGQIGFTNDGQGPEPKIGDLICFLAGGPVPFIFRKEADKYRFIGACHLEGYMCAETQRKALERGALRDFDLN
jgi:hypothetical protein